MAATRSRRRSSERNGSFSASLAGVSILQRSLAEEVTRTPLRRVQEQQGRGSGERYGLGEKMTRTRVPRDSPTLAMLQRKTEIETCGDGERTAGRMVLATQRVLEAKHHEAKSRVGAVSGAGGGVSLWPAMDDMRLSRKDIAQLLWLCALLVCATVTIFALYHGPHERKLKDYATKLQVFPVSHPMSPDGGQEMLNAQLIAWHKDFLSLQNAIHKDFDMDWAEASIFDIFSIFFYICGIGTLLYFLLHSMFSKNRLTPKRIKIWASLLCVVTSWTVLTVNLLLTAQSVETASQDAVHALRRHLADLVLTHLDLTQYQTVLHYWQASSLPPSSPGILSVLGLFQLQDFAYYLQYYSLPIITAICTPIVKLGLSLKTVYGW